MGDRRKTRNRRGNDRQVIHIGIRNKKLKNRIAELESEITRLNGQTQYCLICAHNEKTRVPDDILEHFISMSEAFYPLEKRTPNDHENEIWDQTERAKLILAKRKESCDE